MILYQNRNLGYLDQFFERIRATDYLLDVLRENYVLFGLEVNSAEGRRVSLTFLFKVVSLLNDQVLTPSFLFVFNTSQRNLNQSSLLNKLEGEFSDNTFQESLIHNIELSQQKRNNLSNITLVKIATEGFEDENSHAAMIKMQNDEMKKLEEMEREKRRKEIEEQNRIKKENEEKLRKEKEKEDQRKQLLKSLPVEPAG